MLLDWAGLPSWVLYEAPPPNLTFEVVRADGLREEAARMIELFKPTMAG